MPNNVAHMQLRSFLFPYNLAHMWVGICRITTSLSDIVSTLRGLGYNLDSTGTINSLEAADIVAYEALIDRALHPAVVGCGISCSSMPEYAS